MAVGKTGRIRKMEKEQKRREKKKERRWKRSTRTLIYTQAYTYSNGVLEIEMQILYSDGNQIILMKDCA